MPMPERLPHKKERLRAGNTYKEFAVGHIVNACGGDISLQKSELKKSRFKKQSSKKQESPKVTKRIVKNEHNP